MFSFSVNLIAVLVSSVISFFIGILWYSPVLFEKAWIKLSGITEADMEQAKRKGMAKSFIFSLFANTILVFILSNIIDISGSTTFIEGMLVGAGCWLGFVATVSLNMVLWDAKPFKLYLLHILNYLVSMTVAGGILSVWI